MKQATEIGRFYDILGDLEKRVGGKRLLADCRKRTGWPARGVYFFFEDGERRSGSGIGPRVVRIGTHALKSGAASTLWGRLSQHRGGARGGNHRGSIFRLLVGDALKARRNSDEPRSWGIGTDPGKAAIKLGVSRAEVVDSERELELLVNRYIGVMPCLWLAIEDDPGPESLRGYVERNVIALLSGSGAGVDPQSQNWLGQFSSRERVQRAGLWNNNHVAEHYEPDFLDKFTKLVSMAH